MSKSLVIDNYLTGIRMTTDLLQVLVSAGHAAALDVADVNGKGGVHAVDGADQLLEGSVPSGNVVGHVAQCHEGERGGLRQGESSGAEGKDGAEQYGLEW